MADEKNNMMKEEEKEKEVKMVKKDDDDYEEHFLGDLTTGKEKKKESKVKIIFYVIVILSLAYVFGLAPHIGLPNLINIPCPVTKLKANVMPPSAEKVLEKIKASVEKMPGYKNIISYNISEAIGRATITHKALDESGNLVETIQGNVLYKVAYECHNKKRTELFLDENFHIIPETIQTFD